MFIPDQGTCNAGERKQTREVFISKRVGLFDWRSWLKKRSILDAERERTQGMKMQKQPRYYIPHEEPLLLSH
jgi:hypothetical protein